MELGFYSIFGILVQLGVLIKYLEYLSLCFFHGAQL